MPSQTNRSVWGVFTMAASALVLTAGVSALALAVPVEPAGDTVNSTCPISSKAISAAGGTVTHGGASVGFCCGNCKATFEGWDDARKDSYLASARQSGGDISGGGRIADGANSQAPAATAQAKEFRGDPYTLTTCAVAGSELGSMGDPVVKIIKGREVRFCCAGCIKGYEENPAQFMAETDKKMIADQKPLYPLTTCVVSGNPLVEDGKDVGIDHVSHNRLFRLCCEGCIAPLEKTPEVYFKKLDAAVVATQRPAYPMDACVVMPADSLSDEDVTPVEHVASGRLVRFCCKGCIRGFEKNPASFIAKVDAAWKASDRKPGPPIVSAN